MKNNFNVMFEMLFVVICMIISNKSLGVRKNAIHLTLFEKEQLLDGLYKLKSTPSIYNSNYSAYDYFVAVHIVSNDPFKTYGHAQWSFLPWHRTFLYLFERELQRVLNNNSVYLPYWNVANNTQTEILLNDITFLGGNGSNQYPYLLPNNSMLSCNKFAINHNLNGRKWQYNYTCLSRTIGAGTIIDDNILIASKLPKASEWNELIDTYRPYDVSPYNTAYDNFTLNHHLNSFRSLLDGCTKWIDGKISIGLTNAVKKGACPYNLHGNSHVYIGGQLASAASPNDPLFFLLHSFVDLLWGQYQDKYGDDSFPTQFIDIKLFANDEFISHKQWTSNHVMDHRVQLDYMYDIQVEIDDVIQSTQPNIEDTESVKIQNNINENELLEPPLMYIWIGVVALMFAICISILICCCFIDAKSKTYNDYKPNSKHYTNVTIKYEQECVLSL
eukprot:338725_1